MQFAFGNKTLDLSTPVVMGILNTTPDSFSDGGSYYRGGDLSLDLVLQQARQMVADGAAIVDVGGESTRPGAEKISLDEELSRVVPVVEVIARELGVVVSVDTSSPAVMREAAAAGAGLINDVRALRRDGAVEAAAETGLPVCLMHMQGEPGTMQEAPVYDDVVTEVQGFFRGRIEVCEAAGIARDKLLLDPGYGFGKTDAHNLMLLKDIAALAVYDLPLLVGWSRKSIIGRLLGREVGERLPASLALALMSVQGGAKVVRVHDVAETSDVLSMYTALQAV